MSKIKLSQAPKKNEVSLVRSSAAEYLTFVAADGHSEASVGMRYEGENVSPQAGGVKTRGGGCADAARNSGASKA